LICKKGGESWHILVKTVEQLQTNRGICAIPAEIKPTAVSVELLIWILAICAKINLQP